MSSGRHLKPKPEQSMLCSWVIYKEQKESVGSWLLRPKSKVRDWHLIKAFLLHQPKAEGGRTREGARD